VSLSLKPRSAIGLAGHGGTVVTWTDDLSTSFVTSRAFSPTPIETVRAFLHKTPYVADAKKTWLLSAPEGSYRFPDANAFARRPATQTGLFPHRFPAEAGRAPAFLPLQPMIFASVSRRRSSGSSAVHRLAPITLPM